MIGLDDLGGLPVHEALLAEVGGSTVHAVRTASPHYLLDVPEHVLELLAVRLALHHLATERGRLHEIPADLAPQLVEAIGADDVSTLAALAAGAIPTERTPQ
ncbi:hypothetical protein [Janibacter melonis]|uniref:hypothetical protein n=1 Tax=Janibacter melonis TaxID=262209 RepID=UPI00174B86D1|nr:hypothetical protein [Janibacter melonis]